jgi:hypothetical protein
MSAQSIPPENKILFVEARATCSESVRIGTILCLTIVNKSVQYTMREYSMSEVGRKLRVQRATLYAWIRAKKIPAPKARTISGVRFCFWTKGGLEKIEKYKAEHYREKPTLRKRKKALKIK